MRMVTLLQAVQTDIPCLYIENNRPDRLRDPAVHASRRRLDLLFTGLACLTQRFGKPHKVLFSPDAEAYQQQAKDRNHRGERPNELSAPWCNCRTLAHGSVRGRDGFEILNLIGVHADDDDARDGDK